MKLLDHEIIPLAPQVWCISEFKLVNAFLVEGEEKAALIDCGCGIGNIRTAVEQLTALPMEIFLTHGHPDHAGGAFHYPEAPVYMYPIDRKIAEVMPLDNRFRTLYAQTRIPVRFPGEGNLEAVLKLIPEENPVVSLDRTLDLADGTVFNLGKRTLQAIHTPGHSDGSCCFLDNQSRILFSGDTVNPAIILARQPNNGTKLIGQYHETVSKLWALSDQYDCLAIGHDGTTIDKQLVKDYVDLTAGLLDGSIVGSYEETGFRKGDVARLGMAELWYQCDQ